MNNNFNDNLRLYDDEIDISSNNQTNEGERINFTSNETTQQDNNDFYQNNKQRGSAGLIVFIVILCIAVVGLSGYIVYDNFFKDKSVNNEVANDSKSNEKKLEDITNDSIINDLQNSIIAKFPSASDEKSYYGLYLNANKNNIDAKYLIYYGMLKLIEKNSISQTYDETQCKISYTIPKTEVNDYIKSTFNIDISKYYLLNYSFEGYTVSQSGENYEISIIGCRTGSMGNVLTKLIKAEKDNNNIYIYSYNLISSVSVGDLEASIGIDRADDSAYRSGSLSENSYYEAYDGVKNTISALLSNDEILEKVGNIYKLTFTKNETGAYIWTSSERIDSIN